MSNNAGEYASRLLWLQGTRNKDTNTGQDVLSHAENGYLWCSVTETNGRTGQDYGAVQTGADVEIRVRNYPAITTEDLLKDEGYELVYHIDSVIEGDNELIAQCYRNDFLEDFTVEEDS
jgi:hypothetical protein